MSAPALILDRPATTIAVPAKLRAHIRMLMANGMRINDIADSAQIDSAVVYAVLGANPRGIRPLHARALWTVRLRPIQAHAPARESRRRRTPTASGTRRRLQALVAAGHSPVRLARALEIPATTVTAILFTDRDDLAQPVAEPVAHLFDKLQMVRGEDQSAEQLGQAHRWPRPFDWDEDRIDRPDANTGRSDRNNRPDELAELRAERQRAVAELVERKWSSAHIAAHLRVTERTVQRDKIALCRLAAAGE